MACACSHRQVALQAMPFGSSVLLARSEAQRRQDAGSRRLSSALARREAARQRLVSPARVFMRVRVQTIVRSYFLFIHFGVLNVASGISSGRSNPLAFIPVMNRS